MKYAWLLTVVFLSSAKPEPNSSDEDADDDELTSTAAKFGMSEVSKKQKTRWEKLKPRMWRLIDDPYSSFGANVSTPLLLFDAISHF